MASLQARAIAAAIMLLAMIGAVLWFGSHERDIGAAKVQAKWDVANAAQTKLAVAASESARTTEHRQTSSFAGIASTYLTATTNAYPPLADALPAAVGAGTVRLRNDCPAAGASGDHVSIAATGSRDADAAATQALAQRVADSIAAVRVGEQADARNSQLSAQVTALQNILRAERNGQ